MGVKARLSVRPSRMKQNKRFPILYFRHGFFGSLVWLRRKLMNKFIEIFSGRTMMK
jgi:hypothetical protein